jgi:hypothetical protein
MSKLKTAYKIANAIASGTLNDKQKRKAVSNWAAMMKAVIQGAK